jgi:glycosyltransferase involved in cell wall biosynthesis
MITLEDPLFDEIQKKSIMENNFSYNLYKNLNKDIEDKNEVELFLHWYNIGRYEDRIYSIETFQQKYKDRNNLDNEEKIINWMLNDIYINKNNLIGREIVNNIYEVLIDLSCSKIKLDKGISLIIRAKNEQKTLRYCIESVVDLVDEIILVDNNSTDLTLNIMKEYESKFKKIKVYQYKIENLKIGNEHSKVYKNKNKNKKTIATFYNWCLSKATKYNVIKWDADFICIKNNFNELVNMFDLKNREDKFAIWFTGYTLFENNNDYYLKYNSYYNEYRIYSYKNGFEWSEAIKCEYVEPYVKSCLINIHTYDHPLFYEIKSTSIDEFVGRSSMIDSRDIVDFEILNKIKNNEIISNVLYFDKNLLIPKKIIIITPSLDIGGGNQFIINMYTFYKSLGMNIVVNPLNKSSISEKFKCITYTDIKYNINYDYIENFKPDLLILNTYYNLSSNDIASLSKITKIIFVTHSDVAFSNKYIKKSNLYFDKIITVNNRTKEKLEIKLNINNSKFFKLTNYIDITINEQIKNTKVHKFGVISRFSVDKNIPMFILSLIKIFKKYPHYKCHLIGGFNQNYDNYLKFLCIENDIQNNVIFEGIQPDVIKYYEMLDFIILPSVSEGCPYNLIESLTLGIPVIASDVGGNNELIENEKNGFLYKYEGIKEFEEDTIYINNYDSQLSIIGYYINNENFDIKYTLSNTFKEHKVYLPSHVKCKNKENNICLEDCDNCKEIITKTIIFNKNMENITNSIIKMIEYDDEKILQIKKNGIDFIKNNFNKNLYYNQLLQIVS